MKEDSKCFFIDTNIFIRVFIVENMKMYQDSSGFLHLIDQGKIKCYVSDLVLSEIVWILMSFYKLSKSQTVERLKSIIDLRGVSILNNSDMPEAISLFKNNKVKFIDAIIATNKIFKEKNAIIVSYDKDFDKLGIKRMEPGDFFKED